MAYPMTSAAIEASLDNLVAAFPQLCTKIPLPNAAPFESTSINYSFLRIGTHSVAMPRVALIVAGMHAREVAQPDAATSFGNSVDFLIDPRDRRIRSRAMLGCRYRIRKIDRQRQSRNESWSYPRWYKHCWSRRCAASSDRYRRASV